MKQLTKKEIIELRARAIQAIDESVAWKDCKIKKVYKDFAKATIKADEKAGVLMLVDDEPKEGDFIEVAWLISNKKDTLYKGNIVEYVKLPCDFNEFKPFQEEYVKIIQRNSIPVYQCKKEVKNEI